MRNGSAARRHLIFVGGTSEPGGLAHSYRRYCAILRCAWFSRDNPLHGMNYFERLLADDAITIEVIGPLEQMGWQNWIRTMATPSRKRVTARTSSSAAAIKGRLVSWIWPRRRCWEGTSTTIVHRPFEGRWQFAHIQSRVWPIVLQIPDEALSLCRMKLRQASPTISASPHKRSQRA